eukprot:Blabericola_migrator_1__226@NODE_105_length_14178_cov_154_704486_g93_i0_p2_GENE_NODE_105_length_14178_cov_154_704486_g93_i0NODE_105_length_14178_cov_154_704486_g93_i0_p2_ORF_typecomplete_len623_score89_98CBM_5_12_2/PF14600_6/0_00017CBM_5_12_2/PF14600_6/0_28CBM_5_12_2/PF14600_6/0_0014Glyco_hydro_18/PF00704_28/3_1e08_NODE_105_length_14178_cov_154_704486_g93_i01218414052
MKIFLTLGVITALSEAENCSHAKPYNKGNYATAGTQVHHNGKLWTNQYYASEYQAPGGDAVWVLVGTCDDGTAGIGPTLDCSEFAPWVAGIYEGERTAKVHHNEILWTNRYWAGATDVPGASEVWEKVDVCTPGSANDAAQGAAVDCTGIAGWAASSVYNDRGMKAHYEGALYETKYWSSGVPPSLQTEWTLLGSCKPGSDSTAAPNDPLALDEEGEALMCTCFDGCARNGITGPSAVDATSAKDCYFTWCPKYNNKNDTRCAEVKAQSLLLYYRGDLAPGKTEWPSRVYAPYFDGGLAVPPPLTEIAAQIGVKYFVLAFVSYGAYADGIGCKGSFAGVIPVGVGPTSWNQTKQNNDYLYETINNLRLMGGDVSVAFGGANNKELADATVCQQGDPVTNLVGAYKDVIDTVKLTHIDFDIEGEAAASTNRATGWAYRFAAVNKLSALYPNLHITWTLPVLPTGLTLDGTNFMTDLMASGARWDTLNLMTMDYGDETLCPVGQMGQCEQDAVDSTARQLLSIAENLGLAQAYGWNTYRDVYPKLGSTPMLGMNDITHEVYHLEDARNAVKIWMNEKPLKFISNWSVARDAPCSYTHVDVSCSSIDVQTERYEFAKIYSVFTSA